MLENLYAEIKSRKTSPKEGSYTTYLFDQGLDKILKKVGEEATEVVIAAKNEKAELISETADLTYHLLVLLVESGVTLSEIEEKLSERIGRISKTSDRKEIHDL
ncbi:phosphoribosyl-ATP diphosphatase [Listeria fleischmannii]|uniref:phosphoribosyl-ATP diphosphatase n=1 Tax=Listeria fleischmannii TaxID=1069827 RepID=UPI0016297B48|nr:phosphoribosyl-ATP diphosphatase [Listeria fleischmannii]MBC1418079.1 phosphoribosyl-ATP diphosphatase [Listeria fleischmannii]